MPSEPPYLRRTVREGDCARLSRAPSRVWLFAAQSGGLQIFRADVATSQHYGPWRPVDSYLHNFK